MLLLYEKNYLLYLIELYFYSYQILHETKTTLPGYILILTCIELGLIQGRLVAVTFPIKINGTAPSH